MKSEIQSESHIPSNTGWTWDTDGRMSLIGPGLEKCGKRDAEITSLVTCTMRIHGHYHLGYPTEDRRSKVHLQIDIEYCPSSTGQGGQAARRTP